MLENSREGNTDFEKDLEVLLVTLQKDLQELGHESLSFFEKARLKSIFEKVFATCRLALVGGRQSGSFFAKLAHLATREFCTELEDVIKPNLAGKQLIAALGFQFYECQVIAFLDGLKDGLTLTREGKEK